ncbi:MAG: hypothetical protein GXP27_11330 [Planctomycetes bacterium]|nr:hypothetical protein [Planctomycetota bacterium]
MSTLFSILRRIYYEAGRCLTWLFGAAQKSTGLPPRVYQVVHLGLVAIVVLLLGYFSRNLPGGQNVDSQYPFVRNYYYGILAFLIYVFIRLVIYVIRLFGTEEETEFPDIDEAWRDVLEALGREGIDLQDLPVFLVLGLTEQEEASFFAGARLHPKVIAPRVDKTNSPLRCFATEDAVFLACSGTCLTSRQARVPMASSGIPATGFFSGGATDKTVSPEAVDAMATLRPGSPAIAAQTLQPGGFAGGTLTPGKVAHPSPAPVAAASIPADEVELCRRRLHYLCFLIARERVPFCPANGALIVAPVSTIDASPQIIAQAVREDVQTLHEAWEMVFPAVVVFSGLERLGATQEFIQRASRVDPRFGTHVRAGSRFAAGHPVDEPAARWVVSRGVEWFRRWVYSAFAQDPAAASNAKLYHLLCSVEARREGLAQFLVSALGRSGAETARLTGCYFSAVDPAARRYVFVKDVLQKLIGEQDEVAWSFERVRRDQACRAWSYAAWGASAGLAAADLWLLMRLF